MNGGSRLSVRIARVVETYGNEHHINSNKMIARKYFTRESNINRGCCLMRIISSLCRWLQMHVPNTHIQRGSVYAVQIRLLHWWLYYKMRCVSSNSHILLLVARVAIIAKTQIGILCGAALQYCLNGEWSVWCQHKIPVRFAVGVWCNVMTIGFGSTRVEPNRCGMKNTYTSIVKM